MIDFIAWRNGEIFLNHGKITKGYPWWLSGKESAVNAGEMGSIPGSGRSPGGGNGNPLQRSYWKTISWIEEPGGLQSMGSQRLRHNGATKHTGKKDSGVRQSRAKHWRDAQNILNEDSK